ncbi:MAG TPA: ABC transporter permease [Pseudonocardia sp.]|uniref:ABC transporter permease n=1 Tax=Pseudonocardia sp. TaxID=60912 RepID=UPI002ED812ED
MRRADHDADHRASRRGRRRHLRRARQYHPELHLNLAEDYVRTARSKGAGERTVLVRHVLRNSLIPIATLLGLSLPAIFSGALITEAVFNFPGMGELFWTAAQTQDYPIMLGITVLVGLATVIGSLLADLAYAALDPRVRFA